MLSGLEDKAKNQSCLSDTVPLPLGLKPDIPGELARLRMVPEPPGVTQVAEPEPVALEPVEGGYKRKRSRKTNIEESGIYQEKGNSPASNFGKRS